MVILGLPYWLQMNNSPDSENIHAAAMREMFARIQLVCPFVKEAHDLQNEKADLTQWFKFISPIPLS